MADYSSSSGLGSIVYPEVQKNLFQRMEEARKGELDGNSTRAIWVRMVSGVSPKEDNPGTAISDIKRPVILFGGTVDNNGSGLRGGFDQIFGRDNIDFGQSITGTNFSATPDGEKYSPMAGITGITTTTTGELGALRKATISWNCWSLEQLEFFERFFMKLATTCMVEFGWSTGQADAYTLYDCTSFEKAKESIKDGVIAGKKKTLDAGGEYEVFSGLVSNYSWTVNDAGGFDCETELMSHGEPMIGARTNDSPQASTDNSDIDTDAQSEKELEYRALNNLQKYLDNIDSEMDIFLTGQGADTSTSQEPDGGEGINRNVWPKGKTHVVDVRGWNEASGNKFFVTWGWMEDNILSKYMGRASKNYAMKYTVRSRDIVEFKNNKATYQSVKVSCHPDMLLADVVLDARIATISDNNPMYAQFSKPFGESGAGFENFQVPNSAGRAGYLRNIILNVDTIKEAFSDVNTLTEGLEKLFSKINEAFFGIFDLKISVDHDNPTNIKIIDSNFFKQDPIDLLKNPSYHKLQSDGSYEGKYDSIFILPSMTAANNIVQGQEMQSKVPSEGMYAAMAGANKPSDTPDPADAKNSVTANVQSDDKDGLVDALLYGFNIPDAFSTNNKFGLATANVSQELDSDKGPPITENAKTAVDEDWWEENSIEDETDVNKSETIIDEDGTEMTAEEYNDSVPWYKKVGRWFSTKAKAIGVGANVSISNKEIMSSWMKSYWTKKIQVGVEGTSANGTLNEPTIIPLEVSFTIDGCGGLFPGNTIHTQFIPKKYKDRVTLIIKNVDHTVSSGGWTTSIKTMMVASFNKDKYGTIETPEKAKRRTDSDRLSGKRVKYVGPIKDDNTVDESHYTQKNGYVGKALAKHGSVDYEYYYNKDGDKEYRLQGAQGTPTAGTKVD